VSVSPEELREVYDNTVIVRKPTYGIVRGYHELPYVLFGAGIESGSGTTCVSGKVQVSPRFLIRPERLNPNYADVFGNENIEEGLAGRIFGFMGFRDKPVECKLEHLEVKHTPRAVEDEMSDSLDHLRRHEDITTGVILTPNARYYPVSIERFIASILEDEFRA